MTNYAAEAFAAHLASEEMRNEANETVDFVFVWAFGCNDGNVKTSTINVPEMNLFLVMLNKRAPCFWHHYWPSDHGLGEFEKLGHRTPCCEFNSSVFTFKFMIYVCSIIIMNGFCFDHINECPQVKICMWIHWNTFWNAPNYNLKNGITTPRCEKIHKNKTFIWFCFEYEARIFDSQKYIRTKMHKVFRSNSIGCFFLHAFSFAEFFMAHDKRECED